MRRAALLASIALLAPMLVASPAQAAGERLLPVPIETESPALLVTSPPGDARLFAAERAGRISVLLRSGATREFLDFSSRVGSDGEGGFLGLAFSPDYADDGHLYVHYTNTSGDTRIDRYTVSSDPDRADPASRVQVLAIDQPRSNHNGGSIEFAPDGTLLVALGDGGGANDPERNGQDLSTCLGGILRISVLGRSGGGHGIPSDNPLAGQAGRCQQLWAWGLRNPFRMSVDGDDVWIGDVGQSSREEINRLRFRPRGNYNLGWPRYEGTLDRGGSVVGGDLTFPVEEYATNGSASVTGGYVVRSPSLPDLQGRYVYGDFVRGFVRVYDPATDRSTTLFEGVGNIVSFGEDGNGELYVLTFGGVQRIAGATTRALQWFLGDGVPPRGASDLFFGSTRLPDRTPLFGDWDGDGTDTPGLAFTQGRGLFFALDDDLAGGSASRGNISYGRAGDVPLAGDMDGDGDDDIVIRRGSTFHIDAATDGGAATSTVVFGRASDVPLLGDVDGDGVDDLVVRRGNTWFVDTDRDGGRADIAVGFGRSSDTPLLGDLDGDGDDDMVVRRGNRWYGDDVRTGGGRAAVEFSYGRASDVPVLGNHRGDRADEPVVVR